MDTIYLTPDDIASLLKLSKRQVQCLINGEGLSFNRYRHRVIVKLEELIKFLAGHFTSTNHPCLSVEDPEGDG